MTLASLLLAGLVLVLYMSGALSRGRLYLYAVEGEEDPAPVMEMLVPEDEADVMVDRNDTKHLPDFLTSKGSNRHRVVEFYAPWCPHCIHFKSHYIGLARQLTAVAEKLGENIDFYAVSCTANAAVCQNQEIEGYPTIRVFPAGSTNGTSFDAWEVHPFSVLSTLKFQVDASDFDFHEIENEPVTKKQRGDDYKPRHVRNKQELYGDAYLSFDFAMRNGIFVQSPTLTNTTGDALQEWLTLLQKTTPPVWKIQRYIAAILDDFDTVTANETIFSKTIEPFKPEETDWSPSCTHENGLPGYTCGLWELFHIMTVGLVEWNKQGDNKWIMIPTDTAADALRDYIANFFGCEVCQHNFLSAYEACAFDRCNRLKPQFDDDENDEFPTDWVQLPLWLWETHNAVNVRLMHERAEREGRTVTAQDEDDVRWPSRQECPGCWRDDGTWDEDVVYKFLRISYWIDDSVTSEYRHELESISIAEDDDETVPVSVTLLPLGVLAFFAIGLYSKRVKLEKSGRHKKCEDTPPDDTYSSAA